MKKISILILMSVMTFVANAQTDKGTLLLGGGVGYDSEKTGESSTSTLSFSPNVGYFLKDNLAIGANIDFISENADDVKSSITEIGPFVRYYAFSLNDNAKIFGQAKYSFGSTKIGEGDAVKSSGWGIAVGPAFFLNESVALETTLNYGSRTEGEGDPTNGFGLNVGFQIHFKK